MISRFKISAEDHLRQPLKVHELLKDFDLEDVWRYPMILRKEHSLQMFLDLVKNSDKEQMNKGLAGWLFRFRMWLGEIFGWDDQASRDTLIPGTIRHRYASDEGLTYKDLPDPGNGQFVPVYQIQDEYLSEIENKTVHAALHLNRVSEDDHWRIHMAVYVKPKGIFGRFYMALIKPFRLWVIYPTMMRMANKKWNESVK